MKKIILSILVIGVAFAAKAQTAPQSLVDAYRVKVRDSLYFDGAWRKRWPQKDGLISGGIVSWTGVGLNFDVTSAYYSIRGTEYTSPNGVITLNASHPTLPRIDVIAVNNQRQIVKITGVPSTTPVTPQVDLNTQVFLTSIFIGAGATSPTGVTNTYIYDENVEWTGNAATANFNNTSFPFIGSKAVDEFGTSSDFIRFTNPAGNLPYANYSILKFRIRLKGIMPPTTNLLVSLTGIGFSGSQAQFFLVTASNGFSKTIVGQYQVIAIPIPDLQGSRTQFNTCFVRADSTNSGFYLDAVALQGGLGSPSQYWSLGGNGGTNENLNFVGTTDNVPLIFKVNNERVGFLKTENFRNNLGFGKNVFDSATTAYQNIAFGDGNLRLNKTGTNNIAIGDKSQTSSTNGSGNIGIGSNSLTQLTTGFQNTGIGNSVFTNNTTGNNNIALGNNAGFGNTTASNQLFVNSLTRSGYAGDTSFSILYGVQAAALANQRLKVNGSLHINDGTQGIGKIFTDVNGDGIGSWQPASGGSGASITADYPLYIDSGVVKLQMADYGNDGGITAADYTEFKNKDSSKWAFNSFDVYNKNSGNVGIGTSTPGYKLDVNGYFRYNSDRLYNIWGLYMHGNSSSTFLGRQAGNVNATGGDNDGIGKFALQSLTTGGGNVTMGTSAGYGITTGNFNIYFGRNAGVFSPTGSYNIAIGSKSSGQDTYTGDNNIALGYNAVVPNTAANNQLNIGNWIYGANGNIGIGVTVPTQKFEVSGNGVFLGTISATNIKNRKYNETYTGSTSTTITLANNYATGTIRLYKNGIRLLPTDFTENLPNTITLSSARLVTDNFNIDYDY